MREARSDFQAEVLGWFGGDDEGRQVGRVYLIRENECLPTAAIRRRLFADGIECDV